MHNMEDGGVVLWYPPAPPRRTPLTSPRSRRSPRVLLALRDRAARGHATRYALTAWQRLQRFDDVDADGMRAFLAAYHGIDNHR